MANMTALTVRRSRPSSSSIRLPLRLRGTVAEAFGALSLRDVHPGDAGPADLPWMEILDDDDATRSAAHDVVFDGR